MPYLQLDISRQPDDTTCGPTSLHAVYRYFGDDISLQQVISEVHTLEAGGTLAALLGAHALRRGYRATLYSYNMQLFDPTWFHLGRRKLRDKLRRQAEVKHDAKLRVATEAYLDYLELGGKVRFSDLSPRLLRRLLRQDKPVLVGLSATYLYREPREIGEHNHPDDIVGEPVGHFTVLCGVHGRRILVADPMQPNALATDGIYEVDAARLVTSILLGVLTYDGTLLQISPPQSAEESTEVPTDEPTDDSLAVRASTVPVA